MEDYGLCLDNRTEFLGEYKGNQLFISEDGSSITIKEEGCGTYTTHKASNYRVIRWDDKEEGYYERFSKTVKVLDNFGDALKYLLNRQKRTKQSSFGLFVNIEGLSPKFALMSTFYNYDDIIVLSLSNGIPILLVGGDDVTISKTTPKFIETDANKLNTMAISHKRKTKYSDFYTGNNVKKLDFIDFNSSKTAFSRINTAFEDISTVIDLNMINPIQSVVVHKERLKTKESTGGSIKNGIIHIYSSSEHSLSKGTVYHEVGHHVFNSLNSSLRSSFMKYAGNHHHALNSSAVTILTKVNCTSIGSEQFKQDLRDNQEYLNRDTEIFARMFCELVSTSVHGRDDKCEFTESELINFQKLYVNQVIAQRQDYLNRIKDGDYYVCVDCNTMIHEKEDMHKLSKYTKGACMCHGDLVRASELIKSKN